MPICTDLGLGQRRCSCPRGSPAQGAGDHPCPPGSPCAPESIPTPGREAPATEAGSLAGFQQVFPTRAGGDSPEATGGEVPLPWAATSSLGVEIWGRGPEAGAGGGGGRGRWEPRGSAGAAGSQTTSAQSGAGAFRACPAPAQAALLRPGSRRSSLRSPPPTPGFRSHFPGHSLGSPGPHLPAQTRGRRLSTSWLAAWGSLGPHQPAQNLGRRPPTPPAAAWGPRAPRTRALTQA